ncbi:MAG TPA: hypothetical protein VM307_02950 [Egibacteraceae bacterium]|nr:hypothetical protein [Egibacteraceae bacterium]
MTAPVWIPALAHVKWYVDDPHNPPVDLRLLREPLVLGAIVAIVALTVGWRLVARRGPTPELPVLSFLGAVAPWIPRLLGIHLGVSLLSLAVSNAYLAPHLSLDDVPLGGALALLQGVIGVWLITGVWLRPAALAVVLLGPIALLFTGVVPVVEAVDTLGVAIFLLLLPPTSERFGARPVTAAQLQRPLMLMRMAAGLALVVLAFSEKLLVPDLANELLAQYPEVDVFRIVGITLQPDTYVVFAGLTELLFGLLLISAAAPQVVVLVAAVPFNLTLLVFDRYELIGHLPVYGLLLALLVYGSHPDLAPAVPRFTSLPADDDAEAERGDQSDRDRTAQSRRSP